jgi:GNAT superfamily N-acetyltransferase
LATGVTLRDAGTADTAAVLLLLRGLAEYERLGAQCVATEADLARVLFGQRPYARALLAEWQGRAVGMAIWHTTLSTFTCRPGYFLEDLFVEETARGQGIGRAIFAELARRLATEGGQAIAWRVLAWNAPSIGFYRGLGAVTDSGEWNGMSLSGDALARLVG